MIAYLFTCGPFVLMLCTFIKLALTRQWPRPIGIAALTIASANAIFAAYNSLYYHFRPSPYSPPWKDPQILNYGLLFLSAPIAMIVSSFAAARGTPKWQVYVVRIASIPLFLIGLFASGSV